MSRGLHYLHVRVIQQEVEVVQRRWVFILKPVEKSFLYHSVLVAPVVQGLSRLLNVTPDRLMLVYHSIELIQRHGIGVAYLKVIVYNNKLDICIPV